MPNYEQMYTHLFNAMTTALELLSDGDILAMQAVLQEAQTHTEALYMQ